MLMNSFPFLIYQRVTADLNFWSDLLENGLEDMGRGWGEM